MGKTTTRVRARVYVYLEIGFNLQDHEAFSALPSPHSHQPVAFRLVCIILYMCLAVYSAASAHKKAQETENWRGWPSRVSRLLPPPRAQQFTHRKGQEHPRNRRVGIYDCGVGEQTFHPYHHPGPALHGSHHQQEVLNGGPGPLHIEEMDCLKSGTCQSHVSHKLHG